MATYKVLAPLVQLKLKDAAGALVFRQFYAGAVLDTEQVNLDQDNLDSHLDSGQVVEEGHEVAEVFAVPAGTPLPGKPPNVAVTESGDAASTGQPVPPLSANLLRAAGMEATGDEPYAAESTDRESPERAAGSKPHGNASQTAWREYHVEQLRAQGVPEQEAREQAAGMSRDDIRDEYK